MLDETFKNSSTPQLTAQDFTIGCKSSSRTENNSATPLLSIILQELQFVRKAKGRGAISM